MLAPLSKVSALLLVLFLQSLQPSFSFLLIARGQHANKGIGIVYMRSTNICIYIRIYIHTSINLFIHACVVPGLVERRTFNVKHPHMDKLIYHSLSLTLAHPPPFFWLHEQSVSHDPTISRRYLLNLGKICLIMNNSQTTYRHLLSFVSTQGSKVAFYQMQTCCCVGVRSSWVPFFLFGKCWYQDSCGKKRAPR